MRQYTCRCASLYREVRAFRLNSLLVIEVAAAVVVVAVVIVIVTLSRRVEVAVFIDVANAVEVPARVDGYDVDNQPPDQNAPSGASGNETNDDERHGSSTHRAGTCRVTVGRPRTTQHCKENELILSGATSHERCKVDVRVERRAYGE